MLNLFTPKLPIDSDYRQWADDGLDKLGNALTGYGWPKSVITITPTPEFFPEGWDGGSDACVEATFARTCAYMGVDRGRVNLDVHRDRDPSDELLERLPEFHRQSSGASGLYSQDAVQPEKARIVVKIDRKSDPVRLVATMAHELAHVRLLGGGIVDRAAHDMEPLTDLATVAAGLGLFGAHAAFRFEQHGDAGRQGWSVSRRGYLSEELWGYALARYAWRRGEPRPKWTRHLNVNVRTFFHQSAGWLRAQGRPFLG